MSEQDLASIMTLRPARPEDKNFILATFLRGLYYGESWFSIIPKDAFMEHYHKVIDYLISKPSTEIKVACLKEDQDAILGYSISSPSVIHWVFVRKDWRKMGVAKSLIPKDATTVTHLTKVGLSIIRNRKLDFNPFII